MIENLRQVLAICRTKYVSHGSKNKKTKIQGMVQRGGTTRRIKKMVLGTKIRS